MTLFELLTILLMTAALMRDVIKDLLTGKNRQDRSSHDTKREDEDTEDKDE